jgi:L-aminopeptidase/D-esterase-like protein
MASQPKHRHAMTDAARFRPRYPGHITEVAGVEVGHFTDPRRPTGCTVVLARAGAVAGVDVRGAAPGTRETDLLAPGNLVDQVHAVMLAGGSAFGLDAAGGAMRWLEARGIGVPTPVARIPIVPAAVLFDLMVGDPGIRPDAAAGFAACEAASTQAPAEGNVGAGSGATVGKVFGADLAMRGGIGSAALTVDGVTVAALIACNALGDVVDPDTALVLAGARIQAHSLQLWDTRRALIAGHTPKALLAGTNTTIGVIATNARLTKVQAQKLAQMGHDGLARAINPVHTVSDGDTLFALGTGTASHSLGLMQLGALAAEVAARAVVNAMLAAHSLHLDGLWLPALRDLPIRPMETV